MLHYERQGTGEPLLLLHGFLSNNRVYDKVLSALTANYDVIAIDLPGHGKSPYSGEKTIYDYADKVINLLDNLQVKQATWIGHSMGGYITMAAVEKYESYVKRAAFVYSSPIADSTQERQERNEHVEMIKTQGLQAFIQKRIPAYFSFQADPQDLEEAFRHAEEATVEGAIAATYAMKNRPDQVEMINRAKVPLFFLTANKDVFEKTFLSNSPHIIKATTMTSHMGMLDEPQQFLTELQRWLARTEK
ncbi:alpha/beta fold hydrolase [Desertibacillus haloalkaliphilus]|uniref:alpha/beta fold hydrolase n=1 Tax=Desertibacillus haloalkaliphilus TaxID=1328930 RepID=UPI001C27B9C7|nr:alpha/beta hydrolase [Desertibacillus haloalkaliphilus]MBU8908787.1 alpha/beta hydrolase [Desertibacillus haloalkaliphilus]